MSSTMNRKKVVKPSKEVESDPAAISAYDASQAAGNRAICKRLRTEIDAVLRDATSRVWHGAPVWFVGGLPVIGYSVPKRGGVSLLFWNGQAFRSPLLTPMGKFEAAEIHVEDVAAIDFKPLRILIRRAGTELWDVSSILRRRKASTGR